MTTQFKVGQIVIGHGGNISGRIIGGLAKRDFARRGSQLAVIRDGYKVLWDQGGYGEIGNALPDWIREPLPPATMRPRLAKWEDCPWQPGMFGPAPGEEQ